MLHTILKTLTFCCNRLPCYISDEWVRIEIKVALFIRSVLLNQQCESWYHDKIHCSRLLASASCSKTFEFVWNSLFVLICYYRVNAERSTSEAHNIRSNQNFGACFDTFELSFIDCRECHVCARVHAAMNLIKESIIRIHTTFVWALDIRLPLMIMIRYDWNCKILYAAQTTRLLLYLWQTNFIDILFRT